VLKSDEGSAMVLQCVREKLNGNYGAIAVRMCNRIAFLVVMYIVSLLLFLGVIVFK